jgi:hypothetical protein
LEGANVGVRVGLRVGVNEGLVLGASDGVSEGAFDGTRDGANEGAIYYELLFTYFKNKTKIRNPKSKIKMIENKKHIYLF